MILTDEEKAMLDGAEGSTRRKAMELLVRYGEALGAERFVETSNVCSAIASIHQYLGGPQSTNIDATFSGLFLDIDEPVQIPPVKVFSCHLIAAMTSKVVLIAVVTHAPAITELDRDPLEVIKKGDWVKVDADRGIREVTRKE